MANSKFPFTSKSREWFSKLSLHLSVDTVKIRMRHNIVCITTNWTVSYPVVNVCMFATFLYRILLNIHCISVPCYNTNQCRFTLKSRFSSYFVYFKIKYYMEYNLWYIFNMKGHMSTISPLAKLDLQSLFSKPSTSILCNLPFLYRSVLQQGTDLTQ